MRLEMLPATTVLGLLWLLGSLGCTRDTRAPCERPYDCPPSHRCGEDRRCTPRSATAHPCREDTDCLAGLRCAEDRTCRLDDADWCRPGPDCAEDDQCPNHGCWRVPPSGECSQASCEWDGRCRWVDGQCAPGTDADCQPSHACRERGLCSLRGGRCVADKDADCRASTVCGETGRCRAERSECVPGSDEDCLRDPLCKQQGRCSYVDGACRVKTDADCRRSTVCEECGLCRAAARRCVARTQADCRASHQCWNFGQCALSGDRCVASSDADCAASWECKVWGHCSVQGEFCMPDAAGCRASRQCATDGRCTPRGVECVAGSDADCRASQPCHDDGQCVAHADGYCVEPPRPPTDDEDAEGPMTSELYRCRIGHCRSEGRCTVAGTECVAASDRDCRQGRLCLLEGKCRAQDGRCVAGLPTPADCREASACQALGRCQALGPRCVVGWDEDCRRSKGCKEHGNCHALHPETPFGRCVLDPEQWDVAPQVYGDRRIPPRGSRVHVCDEPVPDWSNPIVRLTPATQIQAELVGRDILLKPLHQWMRIPRTWHAPGRPPAFLAVGPTAVGRLAPRLDEYDHDSTFQLSARLLRTSLPRAGVLLFLIPDAFDPLRTGPGRVEPAFVGLTVAVIAVKEPPDQVSKALEGALRRHAHTISCPPALEPMYTSTRWAILQPWSEWRDVEGSWRTMGAEASWHAYGHTRSNWVELHVRRFGDTTLVVMFSSEDMPGGPDLGLLLPEADRGVTEHEPKPADPENRCTLPPKGHIHWALR